MHNKMMRYRQQGLSMGGFLMVAFVAAIVAILAIKIGPMYQEYYMAKKIINAMSKETENATKPAAQLRAAVVRRMEVNYSTRFNEDSIALERIQGGWRMTIEYEARTKIAGNLDAVAYFKVTEDFTKGAGAQ